MKALKCNLENKTTYVDIVAQFMDKVVIVGCQGVCTASGSCAEFSQMSPTKVEAHELFLLTESSLVLKIKNNGLIPHDVA